MQHPITLIRDERELSVDHLRLLHQHGLRQRREAREKSFGLQRLSRCQSHADFREFVERLEKSKRHPLRLFHVARVQVKRR